MEKVPNILSTFRLILAPVFLILFIQEQVFWRALGLAIFFVAAATDFIDGYIARRFDVESDLGIFLDPLADKFLTFAGFFCLPFLDPNQFPWWAVVLIVIRDVAITSLRVYANRKGISMETRITAKAKTALQMIFLYIALSFGLLMLFGGRFGEIIDSVLASDVFFWGMMVVVAVTLYSGIEYLVVNRSLFRNRSVKS
ncbi:MAG: CDP-alcohol phosphatidyltransferase family protein [Balneolaceae bacterium]|nr:CDP-alcohol phosphatidyltransferase family protein [Balneolaceae bacterium]